MKTISPSTRTNLATSNSSTVEHRPDPKKVRTLMQRRSYAVLATVSPAGHPHAAGVLYVMVDDLLVINTLAHSRKARNVAASGRVGVTIPVRRVPFGGPPSAIHFQARAQVVTADDPDIARLAESGQIDAITSHGELELDGSRFLLVDLPRRIHTYGVGMSLRSLIRNPLDAAGLVEFDDTV